MTTSQTQDDADASDRLEELRAEKRAAEQEAEQLRAVATRLTEAMHAAANGDLTRRVDVDAENEVATDLVDSFDRMRTELARTLSTAQEFAEEVDEASSDATTVAEDVRKETERVNESTEKISDATSQQREKITDVSAEMSNLSATIEEVTSTAENVATIADETASRGEEGQKAAEQAIDELDQIQQETQQALDAVEELTDQMNEIGEIVEFITDVAEQTNILALNANIEAARAGDEGEGFAVVANEVKSLAEETKEAAEEIESLIEDIRAQTEETADGMETVEESVSTGGETVEDALDALNSMAERAMETNSGVQEIREATNEQAQTAQEVTRMADEVADLAETTADETDSVDDAMDNHSEQFNAVVQSIKELSGQVSFLREELDDFELDVHQVDSEATVTSDATRSSRAEATNQPIVVGSKQFESNVLLAYMVYELLEETTDYDPVDAVRLGKTQANFDAVQSGETDLYWSYTGTINQTFLDREGRIKDRDRQYRAAKEGLESEFDLVVGKNVPFNNTYVISAPRVWCDETGVGSLPELAAYVRQGNDDLTIAWEADFRDREDAWAGYLDHYDVPQDVQRTVTENGIAIEDTEQRYEAINRPEVDMVQGLPVEPWIDDHDLRPLDDPDNYFPIYLPTPIVHGATARDHPAVVDAVARIGPTLPNTDDMRRLVRQVKVGGRDPRAVARKHLEKSGLL